MKPVELPKEFLDYIKDDIQLSLSRLGVNAKLSYELAETDRIHYVKWSSESFQTFPVLFKEVHVYGESNLPVEVNARHNCYVVVVVLNFYWSSFGEKAGSTNIGDPIYFIDKDFREALKNLPEDLKHPEWFVKKFSGITL